MNTVLKQNPLIKYVKRSIYFVLIICSLYLFLAWATYSHFDPSWTVASSQEDVINKGGKFGAWIIDFLFVSFGYITNFMPFIFLVVSIMGFYHLDETKFKVGKCFLNLLGAIFLLSGASLLASLFYLHQPTEYFLPGGILGAVLMEHIAKLLPSIYGLYAIGFGLFILGLLCCSAWKMVALSTAVFHWIMMTQECQHKENEEEIEGVQEQGIEGLQEGEKTYSTKLNEPQASTEKNEHQVSSRIEYQKDEQEVLSQNAPIKVQIHGLDGLENNHVVAKEPVVRKESIIADEIEEKVLENNTPVYMDYQKANHFVSSNNTTQKVSEIPENIVEIPPVSLEKQDSWHSFGTENPQDIYSTRNENLDATDIMDSPETTLPHVELKLQNMALNANKDNLATTTVSEPHQPVVTSEATEMLIPAVHLSHQQNSDEIYKDMAKKEEIANISENHAELNDVDYDPELQSLAQQFAAQEEARLAEMQQRAKEMQAEDILNEILDEQDAQLFEQQLVQEPPQTSLQMKEKQSRAEHYSEDKMIGASTLASVASLNTQPMTAQNKANTVNSQPQVVSQSSAIIPEKVVNPSVQVINHGQNEASQPAQPIYSGYGDTLIHPALQQAMPKMEKPTTPLPTIDLLDEHPTMAQDVTEESLQQTSQRIEKLLRDFHVKANVKEVLVGPVVTRYDIELQPGVKAAKVTGLEGDLARALLFPAIRVAEVIPGKPYVGIETPNEKRQTVYLRNVLDSDEFRQAKSPLSMALGEDISGNPVVVDLASMPHLLVAGATGSGKSVGVNTMILSLLYRVKPEEVKFIMIDPKVVELSVYNGIPHLLTEVVTDMKKAANALRWCVNEMERRYLLLSALNVRNIENYNEQVEKYNNLGMPIPDPLWRPGDTMDTMPPPLEKLSYIVVIVDEFADLMMVAGKEVEELIARLAQKARAIGIHLILATQRPSVDVITGLIKANVPTRIAFSVASKIDSRTILDQGGAEALLGRGDMLYSGKDSSDLIRVHGAFMTDEEVVRVANDWRARGKPNYIDSILETHGEDNEEGSNSKSNIDELDELFDEVMEFVISTGTTSASSIQRRFRVGFNRAARIMDQLEDQGIVSPLQNGKREILSRKMDY